MKGRSIVVLAIIAVLAALTATWLDRPPGPAAGEEIGALFYPALAGAVNDVDRIVLEFGTPDERVTLRRGEAGWQVTEKHDYPADAGKIRRLLLRLAEAKIVEAKTSNPEYYERLGVEPMDAGDESSGVRVDLGGLTPPVSLIVGRQETRAGTGTYMRRRDEARSYLVDAEIDAGNNAGDWLDTEIVDIDADLIREVDIRHADGENLRLLGIDGRLAMAEMPDGRELSSPAATDPIARGLASLVLEDVAPAAEFDAGEPDAVATYRLSDGRRITARAWQRDADRYLALDVALDPADVTAEPAGATEEEDAQPPAGQDPPRADAETVARQQTRLSGWIFSVPAHRFDQIVRRTEDLLKPAVAEPAVPD
jgi:hypothetical protein